MAIPPSPRPSSSERVRRRRLGMRPPMTAILLESREIAPEVRHFVFSVEDRESFNYVPGQFVSFTAEINGSPITRAYSIASPSCGRRFDLCLNRVVEGKFSPY